MDSWILYVIYCNMCLYTSMCIHVCVALPVCTALCYAQSSQTSAAAGGAANSPRTKMNPAEYDLKPYYAQTRGNDMENFMQIPLVPCAPFFFAMRASEHNHIYLG